MRREWTSWIKHRQWDAFEKEAKADPSHALADTVGELARGFDEKADRRALKKVLYLLSQKGFEPSEIEEGEAKAEEPVAPYRAALMTSADPSGSTFVLVGLETAGKVVWLRATIDEQVGVVEASEGTCPVDEAPAEFQRMRQAMRPPMIAAEVAPEYALSRIVRALGVQRGRAPSVIAYWGRHLDGVSPLPHPTEALKPGKATKDQRYQVAMTVTPAVAWRLELGSASARIMEFAGAIEEGEDPESIGPRRDAWMLENRAVLFTDAIAADHAVRLRDLAMLLEGSDPDQAALVLATAVDLEKKGSESDYARAVVDTTMYLTMRHLKARSAEA